MKAYKVRIYNYGKDTKVAIDENGNIIRWEIPYLEYHINNSEVCEVGSVDMYPYNRDLYRMQWYAVWSWDGETYNKGGHKWYRYHTHVYIDRRTTKPSDVAKMFANRYGKEVQLRKV